MKKKRVKRSRTDLLAELHDQTSLLIHACHSYDQGLKSIGKHIALSLRVLLYHHGSSQALLQQLGMLSSRFLDTAGDLHPRNVLPENSLCFMRIGSNGDYLPRCMGGRLHESWIPFVKWWNKPVVKDVHCHLFHRRDLILNVADTDGGAHVDPSLDEAYMELSKNNSLGWILNKGDMEIPFSSPIMPCVRQIAHEVLETLKTNHIAVNYIVQREVQADGPAFDGSAH
jgi:hypothetical protein